MIDRILTVGGFTLLSRVSGFARDIILAAVLGAGPVADAFFVALRLPNHFRAIFAEGAFNAAFVPAYARIRASGGASRAAIFADRIFTLLLASQIVLLAVALLFTPAVIEVLAPGFSHDPGRFALAVELTRITFPYLLLVTLVTLYGGVLNALQRFAAAAAAPILLNLSLIVALALAAFFPTAGHAAAWGVLVAGVLEFLLVAGDAGIAGVLTKLRWPELDADVRQFFRALGPAMVGSAGVQLALFADTIIASFLPAGALSALYYADRLNQLPIGVIGIAAGTVILPEMSRRIAGGDHHGRCACARPRDRIHVAVVDSLRRRLLCHSRSDHARALHARGLHGGRCRCGGAYAHGLCVRPAAVRAHPQRSRNFLCARRYGDTGQGGVACCCGQHRVQGVADGTARASRPGAGDIDWRLDQSRPGDLVCGARRSYAARRATAPFGCSVRHRRCRACCSVVALSRARCRMGRELARPA